MVASTKKVTIHAPEDLDDLDFVEVGKGGKAVVEAIIVNVFEKLDIIFEARGKKVSISLNLRIPTNWNKSII